MNGAGHDHHHHHAGSQRALAAALAITVLFALAELAGGLLTGSLALLADAGHMATDVLALALSLFAGWMAARPTTPRRTYGFQRAEILAALANGAALVLIAVVIAWQALGRLSNPPEVDSLPMLAIAVAGLLANLAAGAILLRGGGESLNVRGALLHVGSDAAGSVGAILAGAVMLTTGWGQADALASLLIAVLVLWGSWRLVRESVDVLLEAAPTRIDTADLEAAMVAVPGVASVHDIHVWTVTSGFVAMSGHAALDGSHDTHRVLDDLTRTLTHRFDIDHVTIQPEPAAHADECCEVDCDSAGRPRPVRARSE